MKQYEKLLKDRFPWSDVYDVARDIIERIETPVEDVGAALMNAINEWVVFTDEKWALCKHYTLPEKCVWQEVKEDFCNDLLDIAKAYASECDQK